MQTLHAIDDAPDDEALTALKHKLFRMLEEVLDDVESEAISPAHFQAFALGWSAAHRNLRDRTAR
jgi:plasmid maintenance system killer protein